MKIISAIIVAFLVYLAGAFNGASFDISQWSENARLVVSVFMLVTAIATYTFPRDFPNS